MGTLAPIAQIERNIVLLLPTVRRGVRQLEVTIRDFKLGRGKARKALRVHRAGRSHALKWIGVGDVFDCLTG